MSEQIAETTLNSVLLSVGSENADAESLLEELKALGSLVEASLKENVRGQLSRDERVWRLIRANLDVRLRQEDQVDLKVRLIRGVVLLGRNLLSMDRDLAAKLEIRHAVFKHLEQLETLSIDQEVYDNAFVSGFQLLSNLTVNQTTHERAILHDLVELFSNKPQWSSDATFTVWSFINNMLDDSDLVYDLLSKGHGKIIMMDLLDEFERLDLEKELDRNGVLLLKLFYKLIIHESFLKFITAHNGPSDTVRFLKVAEALITSKQSWEVFELTVILSWTWELLQKISLEVQDYFKQNIDPRLLYAKALAVMDCISSLSHYEHAQKFLLSYKGVETLVSLLGTLHQNVKPKRLRDSEQTANKVDYGCFPHIKSMLIETLSSLVYHRFEVQELMREVHGLELVLSNCIIDDNEPFIKERSIVCLRFLLLDNEQNQRFVSSLEAREAVQDDTLDRAGYEVEIVDGKVKLKQKAKIEELQ